MATVDDFDYHAANPLTKQALIIAAATAGNLGFFQKLPLRTNFNFEFTFPNGVSKLF